MVKFNKKAFTLIEMLVVVIILGVVLAIAIPSVSNMIDGNRNRMYQTHMNIVEKQTRLFISQYKGGLINQSASCIQLNYQTLIDLDIITESDIHCNGSIIITKSGSNREFSAAYYLNCLDKNNEYVHKSEAVPTGCTLFTGV